MPSYRNSKGQWTSAIEFAVEKIQVEVVAEKYVPGLSGIPRTASRASIELDNYRIAISEGKTTSFSFSYVKELIDKFYKTIEAAQPRNFKRTTALSLITKAITESLGQDRPRDFIAALHTLQFFITRLQMATEEELAMEDVCSLRDMCVQVSKNTSPHARKMVKK